MTDKVSADRMTTCWVSRAEANAVIREWHSHLKPVVGSIFQLGAFDGDELVGVVVAGRPSSREYDYRKVIEVTRLCTNGHPNAASVLLGRARRVAAAYGFERLVSYTLDGESGTSYKAAGWTQTAWLPARAWKRSEGKLRANEVAGHAKRRWEKAA